MRSLPDTEYRRRIELLRKNTPLRRRIIVRDAMAILGLRSTSATEYTLERMVELGMLSYEPPKEGGTKGEFYLTEEQSDGTEKSKLP